MIPTVRLVSAGDAAKKRLWPSEFIARIAAEVEYDEVGYVASKAKASCDKHDFAVYISGVDQSVASLILKPNQETPNYEYTAKSSNDISTVISVSVLQGCRLSRRVDCHEGDHEAGYIGELVRCVTKDC